MGLDEERKRLKRLRKKYQEGEPTLLEKERERLKKLRMNYKYGVKHRQKGEGCKPLDSFN